MCRPYVHVVPSWWAAGRWQENTARHDLMNGVHARTRAHTSWCASFLFKESVKTVPLKHYWGCFRTWVDGRRSETRRRFPFGSVRFWRTWTQQPCSEVVMLKHFALKPNRPSNRNKEPWYILPRRQALKDHWSKWMDYLYFISVVSNIWEKCSSAQMSMRHFTSSFTRG